MLTDSMYFFGTLPLLPVCCRNPERAYDMLQFSLCHFGMLLSQLNRISFKLNTHFLATTSYIGDLQWCSNKITCTLITLPSALYCLLYVQCTLYTCTKIHTYIVQYSVQMYKHTLCRVCTVSSLFTGQDFMAWLPVSPALVYSCLLSLASCNSQPRKHLLNFTACNF